MVFGSPAIGPVILNDCHCPMHESPKLIYIAGYGRSGSTVLDIMLGSIPGALSCGELTYLFEEATTPGRICACGADYRDCEVWSHVLKGLSSKPQRAAEVIRNIDKRKLWQKRGDDIKSYLDINRQLFSQISDLGYKYVIDSSKSARDAGNRPIALHEILGMEIKLIHLVRSPVSVIRSVQKRSNWEAEGYRRRHFRTLRAVPGWILANYSAWKSKFAVGKNNYLLLHFEDLIRHPNIVIEKLQDFLGLNLSLLKEIIAVNEEFLVGHNIGGNRLRKQGALRLNQSPRKLQT